ncbi:hypothetical protein Q3G72_001058 [Acer saccharum]|nr:hypothetical protein Q3G72_001058 [Acer saccharum]
MISKPKIGEDMTMVSRKEYERQLADEEAQQLRSFQEQKSGGRKNLATRPLGMIVIVKPQPKKAKINEVSVEKPSEVKKTDIDVEKSPEPVKTSNIGDTNTNKADDVSKIGLVSYSDESEDDD